ncbi:chromosome partitioning protein [Actinokineospora cianjurensis]|uniref:MinD-like ATPase involved in chromosome partitioning or flagellar assembly n=1 Tax=Actinokineospora cianjurensis TaxID=585224 RepID=A0A421BC43_9PSEU|nr:chromosome partitioning protein [Actinokineospora cianjurensis]RLK61913.1 MinD-like ATPase involved in chromosome partitioning or flagellar assembly [Actinokineospora cianjurensis]
MLVVVCSVKGSPGATTLSVALGARWTGPEEPVVVEADPGGGDLLARWRLEENPGLKSLAAAARRDSDPGLLAQHTQVLPGGLRVVAGPVGAEQARSALAVLAGGSSSVVRAAAEVAGQVVICDVGRIDAQSPALPLLRTAEVTVLLARARDDELAHVAQKLDTVAKWTPHPALVLVGEGYPTREVERELGVDVLARLPHDPRGAAVLGGQPGRRSPSRSALGKAAASLADLLRAQAPTPQDNLPADLPAADVHLNGTRP